ncbi:MAG: Uma2 family endonuclease [Mesorhizobium sp.]|nr:Uma2 family endonuclease [Mesorhizobium sp.]
MIYRTKHPAIYADLEVASPYLVAEIIDGVLVTRHHGYAAPAMVRTMLAHSLCDARQTPSNPNTLWQVLTLPEIHLGSDVVVPELAAWSVDRLPFLPDEHVTIAPDWVCELTSADPAGNPALSKKTDLFRRVGVRHLWQVDLRPLSLEAFENDGDQWLKIGDWTSDDIVRAPPFDAISFSLAELWPLDKPLGFNEDPQALYAGDR